MAPKIPQKLELQGQNIVLRALPQPEAHPQLQKILSDPVTMQHLQYMSHQPNGWTLLQIQERYQKFLEDMQQDQGLTFIVYLKTNNEVIGNCGFTHLDLAHRCGVSGRILHHPYWGKGLGAECNLLMWQYAIETLGLHRIEFTTFEKNVRVRKAAERLGILLEGVRKEVFYENGQYLDSYVYAFFDRDWPVIRKKLTLILS